MANLVLGGGISGLCTAFYLSKATKNGIKIFESSQRLGGWIKTCRNENGTVFELGPRTLRYGGIAGNNSLELVRELGLSNSIHAVSKTSVAAKNRLIYYNNELITLPNSWTSLFKVNPPIIRPFIFALINDLRTPKKSLSDDSIYNFVTRRFGKDYAEILVSALICGIFAGDAKEISVKALLRELFENEQKYGGVIRGFLKPSKSDTKKPKRDDETKNWSVWSFANGLETLPNHIGNYLQKESDVDINLNARCTRINFENGKVLLTINDKVETAQHLFSSLPSKDLAKILGDEYSFLKQELSSIPFVNVAVVNLEYEGDLLEKKGFGFLVPPNQNLPILGITFDSCIFPQEGKTVLTVMMGGKWFERHFGTNPDKTLFLKIALNHVKSILKIDKEPRFSMVNIMRDCIPQYLVGHSERVQRIRKYIADHKLPLTLIGNSFDGVGVNDAILSAKTGVEQSLNLSS